MKFALHIRTGRPEIEVFAGRLQDEIEQAGASIVATGETPEMVIAVGGDGTMLGAARIAHDWDVPVLGFNLGTLGFLTEAEPEDLAEVVRSLVAGATRSTSVSPSPLRSRTTPGWGSTMWSSRRSTAPGW